MQLCRLADGCGVALPLLSQHHLIRAAMQHKHGQRLCLLQQCRQIVLVKVRQIIRRQVAFAALIVKVQRFTAVQTAVFILRHHITKGKAQVVGCCPQNQSGESSVLSRSNDGCSTAQAASQKKQPAAGLSAAYLRQYGAQLLHLTRNYLRTRKVEAHYGSVCSSLLRHSCSASAAVTAAAEAMRHNEYSIILTPIRFYNTLYFT